MKKNIKFIGAAAAALLAVAPVVASPIAANAAVTVNNATATQTTTQTAGTVTVNISLEATAGKTTAEEAIKSAKVTVEGANLTKAVSASDISIQTADGSAVSNSTVLEANQQYQVVIKNLSVKGLVTGNTYAIAGGTLADNKTSESASNLMNNAQTFTSDAFYVFNKSLSGNPYIVKGQPTSGNVVTSGSVDFTNSVSDLASDIIGTYSVAERTTSNASNAAEGLNFTQSQVENAIRAALKSANVTVDGDTISTPATNFVVNLTGYASNGNTVNFPVTVKVASTSTANYAPVFQLKAGVTGPVANATYTKKSATNWTTSVPVNALVNSNSIANDFEAQVNGVNSTNVLTLPVSVKSSNLNTAVAGNYTVVLTATNPSGKTTEATINVKVGDPGVTKTVQAGSDTATVVTINGNDVTATSTTLANGAKVATYGTVTVNGVSYTRLNSSNSNQYVATQYVDGSIKEEATTEKYVMHNAYYYNSKGEHVKNAGKAYAYHYITVVSEPVTINGASYYKVPGKDLYIKASNIDGTKRTLNHNAYIYSSKGTRLKKNGKYLSTLKKGESVTTYGGSYTIKQNGVKKQMYRIAPGQYVKVSNFAN